MKQTGTLSSNLYLNWVVILEISAKQHLRDCPLTHKDKLSNWFNFIAKVALFSKGFCLHHMRILVFLHLVCAEGLCQDGLRQGWPTCTTGSLSIWHGAAQEGGREHREGFRKHSSRSGRERGGQSGTWGRCKANTWHACQKYFLPHLFSPPPILFPQLRNEKKQTGQMRNFSGSPPPPTLEEISVIAPNLSSLWGICYCCCLVTQQLQHDAYLLAKIKLQIEDNKLFISKMSKSYHRQAKTKQARSKGRGHCLWTVCYCSHLLCSVLKDAPLPASTLLQLLLQPTLTIPTAINSCKQ